MYAVIVEFCAQPAHVQALCQVIVESARKSVETEVGCHQFDVCCDPADPSQLFLYELYDDEAAFKIHLQSAHFLAMNAMIEPWVSSKSVRIMLRVQP